MCVCVHVCVCVHKLVTVTVFLCGLCIFCACVCVHGDVHVWVSGWVIV